MDYSQELEAALDAARAVSPTMPFRTKSVRHAIWLAWSELEPDRGHNAHSLERLAGSLGIVGDSVHLCCEDAVQFAQSGVWPGL